jgi:site-specific recombinase XerD
MKTAQNNKNKSEINSKISSFLEYLEIEKGSSPLTIRNYKHYLARFEAYLNSKKLSNLSNITPKILQDYRVFLSRFEDNKGHGLSRKTQGYHVIAIRSFLRWLIKNDYKVMSPDKIDLPKIPDRQVTYLSGDQIDRLLNAPTLSTITGKRDKAILEVLYSTGLRVSELSKLDRDKLDLERREFGVIGKGGRSRVVFLSTRAADFIRKYLRSRKDHYSPVFIRHSGKINPTMTDEQMRLTPRSIQRMVKKYTRKIKLPIHVTPHVLRHSFATDLLIAGADIRSVQEMLGHKNIATTQIYTHVTNKHLREVHEAFHDKGR